MRCRKCLLQHFNVMEYTNRKKLFRHLFDRKTLVCKYWPGCTVEIQLFWCQYIPSTLFSSMSKKKAICQYATSIIYDGVGTKDLQDKCLQDKIPTGQKIYRTKDIHDKESTEQIPTRQKTYKTKDLHDKRST